jgi:glycosyltransferase involved in cell wall biosynthesis
MIDNVQSFLAGADIFVCSSITEAGPMTVWEAMSMGKAVVTTDVGSVRQYIEDGISGYIVPVGDTKALINKVQDLILSPELAKRMGMVAREVAKEKLDVLPAAQKYADFYKQVLFNC